jgi:predicted enzyme related to lactoylglutathione lyase
MKFGYSIIYVADVAATIEFYERAFGIPRRFLHESGTYGELETGATALAFATHELGAGNLPTGYVKSEAGALPLGCEVAFVTDDVAGAFEKAVAAGAQPVSAAKKSRGVKWWLTCAI